MISSGSLISPWRKLREFYSLFYWRSVAISTNAGIDYQVATNKTFGLIIILNLLIELLPLAWLYRKVFHSTPFFLFPLIFIMSISFAGFANRMLLLQPRLTPRLLDGNLKIKHSQVRTVYFIIFIAFVWFLVWVYLW